MNPAENRKQLYDALSDPSESVEERIDKGLDVGARYLDLPVGFFTRIESGTQKIVSAVGNHDLVQPGETCPLDDAYCRRTIETESPLAIQDADASSQVSDSAFETFDLGTYIGARVVVRGETYGTVCFADTETRERGFSAAERYFVELAAKLVGQALEQRAYQREVTEREGEVRTQEEVYRAVVDASFDLVFQIDSDACFTYISDTVSDLLGYAPEEYLGQPFTTLFQNEDTVRTLEKVYTAVMDGETIEREYVPLEHNCGDRVLTDIRVTPLYSGTVPPEERTPADVVGVQGMARDARGRHRRQRLNRVLNRVLRHNLRNEMSVISSYAELLQRRLSGEEATYARKISATSEKLRTLSETARKLEANIESPPEIDDTDIVPIVGRVAGQIDDSYPDVSVTVNAPESAVAKSAPRLETAVWELMDNAATHAGESPSVAATVRLADDWTLLRITDNGPGLPEQDMEVLVCGKETPLVHGSGLGLCLIHWIVESLGGQLTVPETENGTCIEIALRRADEDART